MPDDGIELRHLRAFVAVAEQLNFSRAAQALHMTQQSLSSQIQQLERRLGTRLLHRTTRRVELTEVGLVMLEESLATLTTLTAALDRVRKVAAGDTGHLALGFTPSIADHTLPALLREVAEQAPALTLRVSEMWQADSVEAVRAGRLDAALARHPELPAGFDSIVLRHEPLGVVVGVDHPLAGQQTVSSAELSGSVLVIWPRDFSPAFFDAVVTSHRAHGYTGAISEMRLLTRGSFLLDPASHDLVAGGSAFSVAFEHQHDPLPSGFVWRAVEEPPVISVHLFWRRPGSPQVHRLARLALELGRRQAWMQGGTSGRAPALNE